MMGTSTEETFWAKEAYDHLKVTHRDRVCAYMADNKGFTEPEFKEAVQTCRQQISYCRLGSHQKNEIVERRIKELNLGSCNLLLHSIRLWPEAAITMLRPFSSKVVCHRYNSLEMDTDGMTTEQKFSGVELQFFPTYYHTWGCPVFFLEASL